MDIGRLSLKFILYMSASMKFTAFWDMLNSSVLFSTKYSLIYSFIFCHSSNSFFFINHVPKFKHQSQLGRVKDHNMNICREELLLLCAFITMALHLNTPAASFLGKDNPESIGYGTRWSWSPVWVWWRKENSCATVIYFLSKSWIYWHVSWYWWSVRRCAQIAKWILWNDATFLYDKAV